MQVPNKNIRDEICLRLHLQLSEISTLPESETGYAPVQVSQLKQELESSAYIPLWAGELSIPEYTGKIGLLMCVRLTFANRFFQTVRNKNRDKSIHLFVMST